MTTEQYQIKAEKLSTFQWYVNSLKYLHWFRISKQDRQKLDKALTEVQSILDKFEEA